LLAVVFVGREINLVEWHSACVQKRDAVFAAYALAESSIFFINADRFSESFRFLVAQPAPFII
jgi:hypothetical protein